MSRPTLVLDLDGTLVDTAIDLTTTLNTILAQEGLKPVPLDQARKLVGHGAKALLERGFAANGTKKPPERIDELFAEYLVHYEHHIADESRPYPNVVNALDRFEKDGWVLAVCTNKIERLSKILINRLGMTRHFKAVCGFDTLPAPKPDARAFIETVRRAGGDMSQAIMVGDSETDVATARAAGVPIVAVTFGYTTIPIVDLAPDRIIDNFAELWDAVASIRADGARQSA